MNRSLEILPVVEAVSNNAGFVWEVLVLIYEVMISITLCVASIL